MRPDFALADLFGASVPREHSWRDPARRAAQAREWSQTYLRLPREPGPRHESLRGFAGTDLLAFGGTLEPLTASAAPALSFVPAIPLSPPEDVWMRQPETRIPGLICSEHGTARVAYLPADLDRRFARDQLPDHGDLLASLARWCLRGELPLELDAPGLIDCRPWRTRGGDIVVHLLNLNNANAWRTPVQEFVPVGPLRLRVRTNESRRARTLVNADTLSAKRRDGWCEVQIQRIQDHEVVVFSRG